MFKDTPDFIRFKKGDTSLNFNFIAKLGITRSIKRRLMYISSQRVYVVIILTDIKSIYLKKSKTGEACYYLCSPAQDGENIDIVFNYILTYIKDTSKYNYIII